MLVYVIGHLMCEEDVESWEGTLMERGHIVLRHGPFDTNAQVEPDKIKLAKIVYYLTGWKTLESVQAHMTTEQWQQVVEEAKRGLQLYVVDPHTWVETPLVLASPQRYCG
jgi:hypothetical protein